jgi:hypothetical protein
MMSVDTSNAGRRFGYLVIVYSGGRTGPRTIACRCVCGKLMYIAAADLTAGLITSCGCQPSSTQYHERRVRLRAQLRREIVFTSALGKSS